MWRRVGEQKHINSCFSVSRQIALENMCEMHRASETQLCAVVSQVCYGSAMRVHTPPHPPPTECAHLPQVLKSKGCLGTSCVWFSLLLRGRFPLKDRALITHPGIVGFISVACNLAYRHRSWLLFTWTASLPTWTTFAFYTLLALPTRMQLQSITDCLQHLLLFRLPDLEGLQSPVPGRKHRALTGGQSPCVF